MSLLPVWKKYMAAKPLTDKELYEFIKGTSQLAKLLDDMGLDSERVKAACFDGEYMKACRQKARLTSKRK